MSSKRRLIRTEPISAGPLNPLVENFAAFMSARGLKPHPWAREAGIRSSTLYNFLSGKSATLSSSTLQKLAKAAGATVDDILSGAATHPDSEADGSVTVVGVIGIYGRLFAMEQSARTVDRPFGTPDHVELCAAEVDSDGLYPIPGGWVVFFEKETRDPMSIVGKLAVVKARGHQYPMVRELRRGSVTGLFSLSAWNAASVDDVEVESAHLVLAITQPAERVSPK